MAAATSADLVALLRQYRLLEPAHLEEVERTLVAKFPQPKALAKELLRRGWLTSYQVNQLFLNRGKSLLLGSYILVDRLGGGGMGEVFKARNWKLGTTRALKIIRKERIADAGAVQHFLVEIRAGGQLTHPNIVRTFDADDIGGTLLLVMEHVEGTDLSKLVKVHGPLPIEQACDFIRQAASGLQHAFERGMVHRDIKPHNLLLTEVKSHETGEKSHPPGAKSAADSCLVTSVIKILDMGLARLTQANEEGNSSTTMTQEGAVLGTPDYIAPEQARESHTVDIRADLYSLGCTFFYLLTGSVPFPKGSLLQKLYKHQFDEAPDVQSLRPEVPQPVAAIVRKLMAKQPEDRFQTPAELVAALSGEYLESVPGGNTLSLSQAVAVASAATPRVPVPGDQKKRDDDTAALWSSVVTPPVTQLPKARRPVGVDRKKLWFLAGGGGVLLLGLLLFLLWPKPGPAPEATKGTPGAKGSGKVDDAGIKAAAGLGGEEQLKEVSRMLRQLNPGFDGVLKPTVEGGVIVGLEIVTDTVTDLSPLKALPKLKHLVCKGRPPSKGKLTDLAPLAGLLLESLDCRHTQVVDLTPLKGMPLAVLNCAATPLSDLTPLKNMPLKELHLQQTPVVNLAPLQGLRLTYLNCAESGVTNLTPLQGMPLRQLHVPSTGIADLTPLRGMALTELTCKNTEVADLSPVRDMPLRLLDFDFKPWRDVPVVQALKTLETINDQPTSKFWVKVATEQAEFEAWAAGVAKSDPKKQVADVMSELGRRNPGFKGVVTPTMVNNVVIGASFATDEVRDVSPVRALPGLKRLVCQGTGPGKGRLMDLSPLTGLGLTSLTCAYNKVADLAPLKDLPLTHLVCDSTPVVDLWPLQKTALTDLSCIGTKITDLTPLAGMRLATLRCGMTRVADLSPLKGMPLKTLVCNATLVKDLTPLAGMPLGTFNCARSQVTDLTPLKTLPLTQLIITGTKVHDLAPLQDVPLKNITFDFHPWRDADALRSIKTLVTVNGLPKEGAWKARDVLDAWCKEVATLEPVEQEKALDAELKKRNPSFTGLGPSQIFKGAITSLQFRSDNVLDLSPVRALPGLKSLTCAGSAPGKGQLADLWPLKGLPLVYINADYTKVADLNPLRGMPLEYLFLAGSPAPDLVPLRDLPLKEIRVNFWPTRDLEILRSLPTLRKINGEPAEDFLKKLGGPALKQ